MILTTSAFQHLLDRLDPDADAAGQKFVDLRLKIVHLLRWRGCPESHADALADVALDCIAAKLAGGENIENLHAFAAAVTRFIWLEHRRKQKEDAVDELPEIAVQARPEILDGAGERQQCLQKCLAGIADAGDRRLILGYYDPEPGDKLMQARKKMAESFGVTVNVLKVRACRLRMRLEACINKCVGGVTQLDRSDTIEQEVTR